MSTSSDVTGGQPTAVPGSGSSADVLIGSLVRPGQTIGEFELREVIGRGGMGTVYKAWQQSLRRLVALKVLAPHISGSRASVVRFQREAQAAAKLHHPNIVPIFALGEEGGTYFYAMELIEGRGLHEIIREERQRVGLDQPEEDLDATRIVQRSDTKAGAPTPDGSGASFALEPSDTGVALSPLVRSAAGPDRFRMIAEHIARVADALDYAHQQGVIHRDIKPHNLMMSRDGRLLITDFGLARVTEQPGITMTSECIGSPLYMAPEQISGSSEADQRSDVYSLAATLYEWLTMRPPFEGKTRESVVTQILSGDLREPRQHEPMIPPDLETICLKGMERNARRRYASARELRDDILAFLNSGTVKARRAGAMDRARKAMARHPIALLVAVLVLLAGGATAVIMRQSATIERIKFAQNGAQSPKDRPQGPIPQDGPPHPPPRGSNDFPPRGPNGSPPAPSASAEDKGAESTGAVKSFSDLLPAEAFVVDVVKKVVADSTPAFREQAEGLARSPLATLLFDSGTDDYGTLAGLNRVAATEIFEHSPLRADLFPVDPLATEAKIENLLTALREPDHQKWINTLDGMLLVLPDDRTVRYVRTVLYFKTGRYPEMASDAAKLMIQTPGDVSAVLLHAMALMMSGQPTDAEPDVLAALKLDPRSDLAYGVKGLMEIHLATPESALRSFKEAVARKEDSVLGLMGQAFSLLDLNSPAEAMPVLDQVLELEPANVDALVAHGDCAARLQKYTQAKNDLGNALKIEGGTSKSIAAKIFSVVSAELTSQVKSGSPSAGTSAPVPRAIPADTQASPDAASRSDSREQDPKGGSALSMPVRWQRPRIAPPPASPFFASP